MKNYSIWTQVKSNDCKKIKENFDVDVLIIGGGISGISTLYHLRNSGLKTILVERGTCGFGVTSKSTAKITYLQEKIYRNIRKYTDYETASLYLKSQIEASNMLKDIIVNENILCDFKQVSSYLFTNDEKNKDKIMEEYEFLKSNGVNVEKTNQIPFYEDVKYALRVNDTYVFHPFKYINHFKKIFYDSIYENSIVYHIKKENDAYLCQVNEYQVRAKYVVIATHYPYFLFPFLMPLKTHIETSYIGAFKTPEFHDISAINLDKPCISFRYHTNHKENYQLYLYQSFLSCNVKSISENLQKLKKQGNFDYIWSNNDLITHDYMPYIGKIYKDCNLFLATGYNTWGMTNGTLAGKLISDLITHKKNKYEALFSPLRSFQLSSFLRFPIDIGSSLKAYLKSTKKNVNNKSVIYKKINGVNVAIYRDSNGVEHIVKNKCPHMKCGLVFNEVEKTWDCLCHGSRFDIDGNVIEGPSNFHIRYP